MRDDIKYELEFRVLGYRDFNSLRFLDHQSAELRIAVIHSTANMAARAFLFQIS